MTGGPPPVRTSVVLSSGLRWRVLQAGRGPGLLLLHGSGATIHTWRSLAPLLSPHFSIFGPDLPGHGETELPAPGLMTLPGVAGLVAALLRDAGFHAHMVLAHSAGLAIAARMTLDGLVQPAALAGVSPALSVTDSPVPQLLAPLINPFARSRTVARFVAALARQPGAVAATLRAAGSRVPPDMLSEYQRHAGNPHHVHAVLTMMSRWDLAPLAQDLRRLDVPLLVMPGADDRWITASSLDRATRDVADRRRVVIPRAGHLTHEEQPAAVFQHFMSFCRDIGVVPASEPAGGDADVS